MLVTSVLCTDRFHSATKIDATGSYPLNMVCCKFTDRWQWKLQGTIFSEYIDVIRVHHGF